jgi:hypothetical protein
MDKLLFASINDFGCSFIFLRKLNYLLFLLLCEFFSCCYCGLIANIFFIFEIVQDINSLVQKSYEFLNANRKSNPE